MFKTAMLISFENTSSAVFTHGQCRHLPGPGRGPQFLFIWLVSLIKTPFECVKTYKLWPLDMSKRNFWPAVRFELCTPDLMYT